MFINLTDDELAAVASYLGVDWLTPLPTVAVEELSRAIERGVRSLVVRELARPIGDGIELDDTVCDLVRKASVSTSRQVAYVAFDENPRALAGSYTCIFGHGDDEAVADLVSAGGIHTMQVVTRTEADQLLLASVENAFRLGIVSADPGSAALFATTFGSSARTGVRVGKGEIQFGRFESLADNSSGPFASDSSTDTWDEARVATAVGA